MSFTHALKAKRKDLQKIGEKLGWNTYDSFSFGYNETTVGDCWLHFDMYENMEDCFEITELAGIKSRDSVIDGSGGFINGKKDGLEILEKFQEIKKLLPRHEYVEFFLCDEPGERDMMMVCLDEGDVQ